MRAKHRLINAKSLTNGAAMELSYYVRLRDHRAMQPFIKTLSRIEGVKQVNCFFDEG
jgi:hypothetical protein